MVGTQVAPRLGALSSHQRLTENADCFPVWPAQFPPLLSSSYLVKVSSRLRSFRKRSEWHEIPEVPFNPGHIFNFLILNWCLNKKLHYTSYTNIHECSETAQPYNHWWHCWNFDSCSKIRALKEIQRIFPFFSKMQLYPKGNMIATQKYTKHLVMQSEHEYNAGNWGSYNRSLLIFLSL